MRRRQWERRQGREMDQARRRVDPEVHRRVLDRYIEEEILFRWLTHVAWADESAPVPWAALRERFPDFAADFESGRCQLPNPWFALAEWIHARLPPRSDPWRKALLEDAWRSERYQRVLRYFQHTRPSEPLGFEEWLERALASDLPPVPRRTAVLLGLSEVMGRGSGERWLAG